MTSFARKITGDTDGREALAPDERGSLVLERSVEHGRRGGLIRRLRVRDVTNWEFSRLDDDVRLANLIAFVLLHLHTARTRRDLVGGDRVLVFTEYGDTLEYIRAVLTGLYVLGTDESIASASRLPGGVAMLLDALREAVGALAPEAGEPGDVVSDGAAAPFSARCDS